jgi:uncharacterized membrane protein (Fun14 family)
MQIIGADDLYPTAATIGGGFFAGVLIGYALKKIVKIVGLVVGLFFAGLVYLQYQQIININWTKLQPVSQHAITTIANATMQIPGFNASNHTTALALSNLGIPLAGSMAAGFTLGFVRGWAIETGERTCQEIPHCKKWLDMMFMNPFRKKEEDVYEILLPGEKSQKQPFTSAKQTIVQQVILRDQRTDEQIINVIDREEELDFLDHLFLSNEDMNILYSGSPAAAKTMILKAIMQKFPDQCYFFDFSLTTGKGFIQLLLDKRNSETNISHKMFGKKPKKKNSVNQWNRQDKTNLWIERTIRFVRW